MYTPFRMLLALWISHAGLLSVRLVGQEHFDVGMLACVVQIQRLEPSQPKSDRNDITAISYSSGFIVRDPDFDESKNDRLGSRVFLVTAAHNLVDCADLLVEVSAAQTAATPPISLFKAENETNRVVKPLVYFDCVEDIAVFEAIDDWAEILNSRKTKIVGTLLKNSQQDITSNHLPRGAIASAAGTIKEPDESTIHPAYSCTLSRYIQGWNLVKQALDTRFNDMKSVSSTAESKFAKTIRTRVGNQQFLIVESMSITSGFSGSPVMISSDHFRDSGEIVGMILGGQPSAEVGRAAWAIPAEALKAAIRTLKSANDNKLDWENQSTRKSQKVLSTPAVSGRWIFDTNLEQASETLSGRFCSPYKSRFNIESRIEFRPNRSDGKLCGDDLKVRISNLPGRSFDFRDLEFDANCLNRVNLLTPHFHNCVFKQTRFDGSVLTCPTFYNCKFVDVAGNTVSFSEIIKPPCSACSPAALIAPVFKEPGTASDFPFGNGISKL